MSKPNLRTESVWVARRLEAQRDSRRGRHDTRAWHDHKASARNIHVGDIRNSVSGIRWRDVLLTLIVQGPSIPGPKSPPSSRVDLDTSEKLDWIILKRVRRAATDVFSRPKFGDRLHVLIDWKINCYACDYFIRTIQQCNAVSTLWITVQNVTQVSRQIYRTAQTR